MVQGLSLTAVPAHTDILIRKPQGSFVLDANDGRTQMLATGAIAGIAVGVITILLIIICALIICCCKNKWKARGYHRRRYQRI